MEMNKKEYRSMAISAPETTETNEMIVEGRAISFNTPTLLWEDRDYKFYETIDPGALNTCDISDVCFRYNHRDDVMIMARTRKGSLQLLKDEFGLNIRASLFNIQASRDLYELIKAGAIDQMSFAFLCDEDRITYEGNICTRTILKFKKIFDVSAVDTGAYGDNTSISARSWCMAEAEARQKALDNANLRQRLIIQTYL